MLPTINELHAALSYDKETGVFTRNSSSGGIPAGAKAGGKDAYGHVTISVKGKRLRSARIAWAMSYGEWPPVGIDVDHINGIRDDNRLSNLRLATRTQNSANSKARTGLKGACYVSEKAKWKAQIRIGGKNTHLGYFPTEQAAHEAYKAAAKKEFGEFAAW